MQDASLQISSFLSCSLTNSLHEQIPLILTAILCHSSILGGFLNVHLHAVSTQSGNTSARFFRGLGPLPRQCSRTRGLKWQKPICVHLDARHRAGGPCLPQTSKLHFHSFVSGFKTCETLSRSRRHDVPYSAQNGSHFGKLQCNVPAA